MLVILRDTESGLTNTQMVDAPEETGILVVGKRYFARTGEKVSGRPVFEFVTTLGDTFGNSR